jgi:PAS domain-containing protein
VAPPSATIGEFSGLATGSINVLLDAVPDPMIVTNVDGEIIRVSKSAAQLLGYETEALETSGPSHGWRSHLCEDIGLDGLHSLDADGGLTSGRL